MKRFQLKIPFSIIFSSLSRLFWFILIITVTIIGLCCGMQAWDRYQNRSIVMVLEQDYWKWENVLPAATICPTKLRNERVDAIATWELCVIVLTTWLSINKCYKWLLISTFSTNIFDKFLRKQLKRSGFYHSCINSVCCIWNYCVSFRNQMLHISKLSLFIGFSPTKNMQLERCRTQYTEVVKWGECCLAASATDTLTSKLSCITARLNLCMQKQVPRTFFLRRGNSKVWFTLDHAVTAVAHF